MTYALGILLFAVGIGVTIALHEAGHMMIARWSGMRVRRYFIGFGPTLWSRRRGHTEYGIAAIPFGGFCDIAGMTANDELTDDERPHAMVDKPAWRRIAVLAGGVLVNLLLGLLILYAVAVTAGLNNPRADYSAVVGEVTCSADQDPATGQLLSCDGVGAAGRAGIMVGDRIRQVGDTQIDDFPELAAVVSQLPGHRVDFHIERAGEEITVPVTIDSVVRYTAAGDAVTTGSVGLINQPVHNPVIRYDPIAAIPTSLSYAGAMLSATVDGVLSLPSKVPGVVAAIFGGERAQDSPMSVVGASMVGGELVERSLWGGFWLMLASLNFFLALFNLIPLPPLDGGHILIVLYEKARDACRRLRGLAPGGPVNYERLLPVTVVAAAILFGFGALVLIADVVNPLSLGG